jgi:hypothetical protein
MANQREEVESRGRPKTQAEMAAIIKGAIDARNPLVRQGDPIVVMGYGGEGNWFPVGSAVDLAGAKEVIAAREAEDVAIYNPDIVVTDGTWESGTNPTFFRPYNLDGSVARPPIEGVATVVEFSETEFGFPIYEITLPEGRRSQLERKLTEYEKRLKEEGNQYQNPDLQLTLGNDTRYKIEVLSRLLADGKVDVIGLLAELRERVHDQVNMNRFVNAVLVMYDYCETGGAQHAIGGTGLPQIEKPQE